jgi:arylsulfatase A-like enzyme
MGDNGLLNGEHGMVDKRTMHEPNVRIPIIVRYPAGFREPRVIEQQVLVEDIAPSIVELCGVPKLKKIHGESFVKLAQTGRDGGWRKSWLCEYRYD